MRKLQRGVTLLELIIALGVMSTVVVGAASLIDNYSQNMRASVSAQQVSTFGNAAQAYIKDNYAAVAAVATATTPALIRVSTLTGTNYLQSGFAVANSYGQNICALVLQPTAGQLNALVVTEGGTSINDLDLGQIAGVVGAAGAGIYSGATTTVKGTMGGWSMAIGNFANANAAGLHCDGSAGTVALATGHPMMALWFSGGDTTSGFLYRNSVAGQPQLNQMNTPLIMAATATAGAACTTTGSIAQDGAGKLLSCQGAVWKAQGSAYWQDPVANFAALPACNAASVWQTRVVQAPTTGAGPRAYTCDGTTWQPLGVNDSGNLTVAGNLTVGGTATINAMNGNLQVTATAAEGGACVGEGRIASSTTTSGLILSCQSGVWQRFVKASGDTMSRDGTAACCGDPGTLALAEQTNVTGRLAGMSFHNAGYDEGNMELTNSSGRGRRINFHDNQGAGMRVEADDFYIRSIGKWASQLGGANLKQDACYLVGHGIPQARCAVGYYVAGSWDDGGGYAGDNGMVCCWGG